MNLTKKQGKERKVSKEFLEYITNTRGDCAEDVFKKARTPWQKQVAVELFVNESDHEVMNKDISHIKKLVLGIFTIVALTALANFVSTYLLPLLGAV